MEPIRANECKFFVHHGPGHQSKTRCQITGPHTLHQAIYGRNDDCIQWKENKDKFAPSEIN